MVITMARKLLSLILCLIMILPIATAAVSSEGEDFPFTDVSPSAWYYDAVKYVSSRGIMNGTGGTVFSPDVTVTRAMFVAMLGRLHGAAQSDTNRFPDVDKTAGSWYAGYVGWASENGIITGYDNGNFGPNDPVTREQMATIIIRYIKYIEILPKWSINAPTTFADAAKISEWALSYVEQMRQIGIVQGNSAGEFDPAGALQRSSAATVVMRLHMMLEELALGEPLRPDYTVEGENFALMSAWDLYYGGTALNSDTGVSVKTDGGYPYLTGDKNARKFSSSMEPNPLCKKYYYSVDMKVADIDPVKFPVLRFAYKSRVAVEFGVFTGGNVASGITFTPKAEKLNGWSYGIVDTSAILKKSGNTEMFCATLTATESIDMLYFAAFPDKASAEAFDLTKYTERMKSYDGEVAEMKTASKSQVDAALAEAYGVADAIVNSTNDVDPATIAGACYYISNNGDDSNSGTSPDSPWRTFNNLYKSIGGGWVIKSLPQPGDAVFLERGSVFNVSDESIGFLDFGVGVTYSAYGEGPKPVVSNELIMDEPAGKWVKTEYPNVWKLDYEIKDHPGNISFVKPDGTELWGIFTFVNDFNDPYNTANPTKSYGLVSNGEESFVSGGVTFKDPGCLKNNLEYFGDKVNGGLYVYYDKGNPGEVFREIHISLSKMHLSATFNDTKSTIPTVVDNIAYKYNGEHGISTGGDENIIIRNCTFEWIGGAYQDTTVRYGNAVQNWGSCDGFMVLDCYFKDIYDAAVSTQGSWGIMRNFYSSGCVLDRCDLSFEFFNHGERSNQELSNLFITDNYILNAGIGYCDVRTDHRAAFLYTSYGVVPVKYDNIVYERNVNIFSTDYAIFSACIALGKTEGTLLRDNVYYMDPNGSFFGNFLYNMVNLTGRMSTFIPYTSQYLTYFNSLGVEVGSEFYAVENPDIHGNR